MNLPIPLTSLFRFVLSIRGRLFTYYDVTNRKFQMDSIHSIVRKWHTGIANCINGDYCQSIFNVYGLLPQFYVLHFHTPHYCNTSERGKLKPNIISDILDIQQDIHPFFSFKSVATKHFELCEKSLKYICLDIRLQVE